jgi:XRE family transcriptional regulator, fatty acid utilization regulator
MVNEKLRLIVGLKVSYLRRQQKLTFQQLADATGLSVAYLHDIEKGKKYPRAEKIYALAKSLGVEYDELVSLHAGKKLQPVIDLLDSEVFQMFPLDKFGINREKLLELFSESPEKLNAFIGTMLKIARNYQMQSDNIYTAALRSYQDMHDNYFEHLEKAVAQFRLENNILIKIGFKPDYLEDILKQRYHVEVNRTELPKRAQLSNIRSFYATHWKTLFINKGMSEAQENFLIAREIGFQYLQLNPRPAETIIQKAESFEKLFNNFQASYFASALLMDETEWCLDFKNWAEQANWDGYSLLQMFEKYNVTAEMFLQRLTNLLPKHFNINNIFFLRIKSDDRLAGYRMTKELHLSKSHQPYATEAREEHYCRRWVSVGVIQQFQTLRQIDQSKHVLADVQISKYWETDKEYLCISVAKPANPNPRESVSVTVGLLIDDAVKAHFKFLTDPKVKRKIVHTTCERCSIPDCGSRAIAPSVIEAENWRKSIESELASMGAMNDMKIV